MKMSISCSRTSNSKKNSLIMDAKFRLSIICVTIDFTPKLLLNTMILRLLEDIILNL